MWTQTRIHRNLEQFCNRINNEVYMSCLTLHNFNAWKQYLMEHPDIQIEIDLNYNEQNVAHKAIPECVSIYNFDLYFHFELCCLHNLRNSAHVASLVFGRDESNEDKESRFASILVCEIVKKEIQERYSQKEKEELMVNMIDDLKSATKEIIFLKTIIQKAKIQEMTDESYCSRCLDTYHQYNVIKQEYDKLMQQNSLLKQAIDDWNNLFKTFDQNCKEKPNLQLSPQKQETKICNIIIPEDSYLKEIQYLKTKIKQNDTYYDVVKLKHNQEMDKLKKEITHLKLKNKLLLKQCKKRKSKHQELTC